MSFLKRDCLTIFFRENLHDCVGRFFSRDISWVEKFTKTFTALAFKVGANEARKWPQGDLYQNAEYFNVTNLKPFITEFAIMTIVMIIFILSANVQCRNSTCSGLLVLQSDTLLLMLGHDASLAKWRESERGSVERGTKVTTGKAIKEKRRQRRTQTERKLTTYLSMLKLGKR